MAKQKNSGRPRADGTDGRQWTDPRFRFHMLDVSRGLAALAVLVWHYQHFYFAAPGVHADGFSRDIQPLYRFLWPLYEHGLWGVQLFFVLSGFIFFHVYQACIAERTISASHFFWLRFSRLYPLHFATLLLVAAGQAVSQWTTGAYIVFPVNDAAHFAMNLLFASHWGFQSGFSFNAPVWSVSVEVLLYALFLAMMWRTRSAAATILLGLGLGAAGLAFHAAGAKIDLFLNRDISTAIVCFFLGGAARRLLERMVNRGHSFRLICLIGIVGAASVVLVEIGLGRWTVYFVVFPLLVLTLASLQLARPAAGRRVRLIGDISYSTYLIHFPLQLAIILALGAPLPGHVVANPASLLAFVALVLGSAFLVHRHFEMPAQAFLRGLETGWKPRAEKMARGA